MERKEEIDASFGSAAEELLLADGAGEIVHRISGIFQPVDHHENDRIAYFLFPAAP